MKRRYFLRKIGWVVPVVVTAPIIASELIKEDTVNVFDIDKIKERQEFLRLHPMTKTQSSEDKGIIAQMEESPIIDYDDKESLKRFFEIYNKHGVFIHDSFKPKIKWKPFIN